MSEGIDSTLRYMHQEYSVIANMTEGVSDEELLKLSDMQIKELFTHIQTLKNLKARINNEVKQIPKEENERIERISRAVQKMDIGRIEKKVEQIASKRDLHLQKIEKTKKRVLQGGSLPKLGEDPSLEEKLKFVRTLSSLPREEIEEMIIDFSDLKGED